MFNVFAERVDERDETDRRLVIRLIPKLSVGNSSQFCEESIVWIGIKRVFTFEVAKTESLVSILHTSASCRHGVHVVAPRCYRCRIWHCRSRKRVLQCSADGSGGRFSQIRYGRGKFSMNREPCLLE